MAEPLNNAGTDRFAFKDYLIVRRHCERRLPLGRFLLLVYPLRHTRKWKQFARYGKASLSSPSAG